MNAYQWRNYVKLSPDQMFDGWSYNDIQLKPLAKAINNNLGKGALLLLNMGGEMGTSYFGWVRHHSSSPPPLPIALSNFIHV